MRFLLQVSLLLGVTFGQAQSAPHVGTRYFEAVKSLPKVLSNHDATIHFPVLQKLMAEEELWACSTSKAEAKKGFAPEKTVLHNINVHAFSLLNTLSVENRRYYQKLFSPEADALLNRYVEEQSHEGIAYVARAYRGTKPGLDALELFIRSAIEHGKVAVAAMLAKVLLDDWREGFEQCDASRFTLPLLRYTFSKAGLNEPLQRVLAIAFKCKVDVSLPEKIPVRHDLMSMPLRRKFEFHYHSDNKPGSFAWEREALAMYPVPKEPSQDAVLAPLLEPGWDLAKAFCMEDGSQQTLDALWVISLEGWLNNLGNFPRRLPVEAYLDEPNAHRIPVTLIDLGSDSIDKLVFDRDTYNEYGRNTLWGLVVSHVDDETLIKLFHRLLADDSELRMRVLNDLVLWPQPKDFDPKGSPTFGVLELPPRRSKLRAWLKEWLANFINSSSFRSSDDSLQVGLIKLTSNLGGTLPAASIRNILRDSTSTVATTAAAEILYRTMPDQFSSIIAQAFAESPSLNGRIDLSELLGQRGGCEALAKALGPSLKTLLVKATEKGQLKSVLNYLKITRCMGRNEFTTTANLIFETAQETDSNSHHLFEIINFLKKDPLGNEWLMKHLEQQFRSGKNISYITHRISNNEVPEWLTCERLAPYLKWRWDKGEIESVVIDLGELMDRCDENTLVDLGSYFDESRPKVWVRTFALLGLSRNFPKSNYFLKRRDQLEDSTMEIIKRIKQFVRVNALNSIGQPLLQWYAGHVETEVARTHLPADGRFLFQLLKEEEQKQLFGTWKTSMSVEAFGELFFKFGFSPEFDKTRDLFWTTMAAHYRFDNNPSQLAPRLELLSKWPAKLPAAVRANYASYLSHLDPSVRKAAVGLSRFFASEELLKILSSTIDEDALDTKELAVRQMQYFGEAGERVLRGTLQKEELREASLQTMLAMGGVLRSQAYEILVRELTSSDPDRVGRARWVLVYAVGISNQVLHYLMQEDRLSWDLRLGLAADLIEAMFSREMPPQKSDVLLSVKLIEQFLEENDFSLSPSELRSIKQLLFQLRAVGVALPELASGEKTKRVISRLWDDWTEGAPDTL